MRYALALLLLPSMASATTQLFLMGPWHSKEPGAMVLTSTGSISWAVPRETTTLRYRLFGSAGGYPGSGDIGCFCSCDGSGGSGGGHGRGSGPTQRKRWRCGGNVYPNQAGRDCRGEGQTSRWQNGISGATRENHEGRDGWRVWNEYHTLWRGRRCGRWVQGKGLVGK